MGFLGTVGAMWLGGDLRGARNGNGGDFGVAVGGEGEAGKGQRGMMPAIVSRNSGSMQR